MRAIAFARIALLILAAGLGRAQVQRVVIIKVDGVPAEVAERELDRIDPATHRNTLPWIDSVFRANGTRVPNFYVRAISLSAPSWSLLDTGQHLQIRGNAEYDRYTGAVYDYLNFVPFYLGYAMKHKVDMPGVEVLDDLKIPLLIDHFPYAAVAQGPQLYERGVSWTNLRQSLEHRFSHSLHELLDEWTIGFEIGSSIEEQTERDLIHKLSDPGVRYLDYFTGDYDHVAHATPDPATQRLALQRIDALVGRVWTAIESSPAASRTVLVVVSDHGMNTQPGVFSQGYDLVKFFNSREGGAHHVITNRHPMSEYKLKGLDPLVSEVVTPSVESLYLKDAGNEYPTALLDLDGNERASVYLRNSDWNALQILLGEIDQHGTGPGMRHAAIQAFFQIVDRHRARWETTVQELRAQLAALRRVIEQQRAQTIPVKWTREQHDAGLDKVARRLLVRLDTWRDQERSYSAYAETLARLLALSPAELEKRHVSASEVIPKHALGEENSIYELQNYVTGPAAAGLRRLPDGSLDFERSFERLNYFQVLASLSVRNNVQTAVGSQPVDFIALRLPPGAISLAAPDSTNEDAVLLYHNEDRQALILWRHDSQGNLALRYMPVSRVRQDASGKIHFDPAPWEGAFPLHLWEDHALAIPSGSREEWLAGWHSDAEWLRAVHKTEYANGIIALEEQFSRFSPLETAAGDRGLLKRFTQRKRALTAPDFVIFANDHWNFNVRGFNPGGNHGSVRRISMRSLLMFAGGEATPVRRGLVIQEPYDSLSFVPTILEMMGKNEDARKLPGRPIRELLPPAVEAAGVR
jgi:Type I phosphodiesterase / nucleotide pyrophosphatase